MLRSLSLGINWPKIETNYPKLTTLRKHFKSDSQILQCKSSLYLLYYINTLIYSQYRIIKSIQIKVTRYSEFIFTPF